VPLLLPYILIAVAAIGYLLYASPASQERIGEVSTELVRPVVVPLVNLINAPAFVYIVSLLILLAAVAVCGAYWRRVVRPRIKRLRALRSVVYGLPAPGGQVSAPDALRQLGEALRARELFAAPWAAFQVEASRGGAIPPTPFAYFAASDPTAEQSERRGLMQAMPGYFTSVGLIFTFVGLVVALYFAARGFRSGNIEEARASILQLLNAASFKFLTSVAALVGAFLVSLSFRFSLSTLRRETDETVAYIESYISQWRAAQGASRGDMRHPLADVVERLDRLIAGFETLAGRLDVHQNEAAPLRELHAAELRPAAE
jgi:hypothetical protein